MPLDERRINEILDLMEFQMNTPEQREQCIRAIFRDTGLRLPDIDYSGATRIANRRIVESLIAYGKIGDKQSLWVLLEFLMGGYGTDKQEQIQKLEPIVNSDIVIILSSKTSWFKIAFFPIFTVIVLVGIAYGIWFFNRPKPSLALYFFVDTSAPMAESVDGIPRIDIARDSIEGIVRTGAFGTSRVWRGLRFAGGGCSASNTSLRQQGYAEADDFIQPFDLLIPNGIAAHNIGLDAVAQDFDRLGDLNTSNVKVLFVFLGTLEMEESCPYTDIYSVLNNLIALRELFGTSYALCVFGLDIPIDEYEDLEVFLEANNIVCAQNTKSASDIQRLGVDMISQRIDAYLRGERELTPVPPPQIAVQATAPTDAPVVTPDRPIVRTHTPTATNTALPTLTLPPTFTPTASPTLTLPPTFTPTASPTSTATNIPTATRSFYCESIDRLGERPELSGSERTRESEAWIIHYTLQGVDATTEAYVDAIEDAIEHSLDIQFNDLGLLHPPADCGEGGDTRFDVYLMEILDEGIPGYAQPENVVGDNTNSERTEEWAGYSFLVIDNDFNGVNPPLSVMRATVAHEIHHNIQFGYDVGDEFRGLYEAGAVWIEILIYPDSNEAYEYSAAVLSSPDMCIGTLNDESGVRYYGEWLMVDSFTRDLGIESYPYIWEVMAVMEGLAGFYAALRDLGTTPQEVIQRMAIRNLILDYALAEHFNATVFIEANITGTGLVSQSRNGVQELGVDYIAITAPGRYTFELPSEEPLAMTVVGIDTEAETATVYYIGQNGTVDTTPYDYAYIIVLNPLEHTDTTNCHYTDWTIRVSDGADAPLASADAEVWNASQFIPAQ